MKIQLLLKNNKEVVGDFAKEDISILPRIGEQIKYTSSVFSDENGKCCIQVGTVNDIIYDYIQDMIFIIIKTKE